MTRKNRQFPPQEEPLPLTQVRYVVTTAPRTSDPVDGYYDDFKSFDQRFEDKGKQKQEESQDM